MNDAELMGRVEAALFAPDASRGDVERLCAEARRRGCHAVCVNGSRVELARSLLEESAVKVAALVGFPLGAMDADVKRFETETAVDQGAQEIDCVLNLGLLKDGAHQAALREMRDIVEAADERPVKMVLEARRLTREEQALACRLALDSGAQFVGMATGFGPSEITAEEVAGWREMLGGAIGIKAAGGISDVAKARALAAAGAARIGVAGNGGWWRSLPEH